MNRLLGAVASCAVISLVGVAWLGLQEGGVSHGHGQSAKPGVRFIQTFTNDDGRVDSPARDPNDDGTDPGYDKRVAECLAWVDRADRVRVDLANGYPGYSCVVWVRFKNVGNTTLRGKPPSVTAPDVLTVLERNAPGCLTVKPGKSGWRSFLVRVEQPAEHRTGYHFTIDLKFLSPKTGACP